MSSQPKISLKERAANWYILEGGLNILSPDTELKDWAKAKAKKVEKYTRDLLFNDALQGVEEEAAIRCAVADLSACGIEVFDSFQAFIDNGAAFEDQQHRLSAMSDFKRLFCHKWWIRKARVVQARALETEARAMGSVHKKAGLYCSDWTYQRRMAQKKRNRELLEALEATNDKGQRYTLQELSDLGVANPELRRLELMARIGGFERLAAHTGLFDAVFFTVTCPSKYHAYHHWGERNEKWNGTTPRQAHQYLQELWERVRAAWLRAGIRAYGFRVVEPHHDGCPHWHLILWFPKGKHEKATRIFKHYAEMEDMEELANAADDVRFKPVLIDESKGSAAGYVVKYVSKNIDGHNVGADSYGRDAIESARRIEAWASTWGIRQFQQIGGPSVTVWRELRRCRDEFAISSETFEKIREAANGGDWAAFTDLMGGPTVERDQMKVRAYMVKSAETNNYLEFTMTVKGVVFAGGVEYIETRPYTWTIGFIKDEGGAWYDPSAARQGAHGPP